MRRSRGTTLLEVLVTLVIVSLVAGVATQALTQLARIEQLMSGAQLSSMADSVRLEWVRAALEGLMPDDRLEDALKLGGDAHRLDGRSAAVPQWPAPGISELHLKLVYDDAQDQTRLDMTPEAPAGTLAQPVTLLRWAGREGRFRYLDAKGDWHDEWPVMGAGSTGALPLLPAAIALETGLPDAHVIVAALRLSSLPVPTRRQMELM